MSARTSPRTEIVRSVSATAVIALLTGVFVAAGASVSQAEESPIAGASIMGTVTDAISGEALAGIDVSLSGPTGTIGALTASNGTYTVGNLSEGVYSIALSDPADEYFPVARSDVQVASGGQYTEDFGLSSQPNFTISGRVASGGEPVAGITVNVFDMDLGGNFSDVTDLDGRYSITGMDGGTAQVSTEFGTPYIPHFSDSIALGPDEVVYDFELALEPTGPGSVRGVVKDRDTGAPIPGATISLRVDSVPGWSLSAVSATDGTYSFTDLPLTTVMIDASRFDYTDSGETEYNYASVAVLLSGSQQNRERDIRLRAVPTGDAVLSGCVTEIDGITPISGLTVSLMPVTFDPGSSVFPSTTTDEFGCYTLSGLLAGEFRIGFYDFDSRYRELSDTASLTVIPTPDAVVEKDLVLERYPVGTGTIRGTVTDARTGLAIEGLTIFLSSNERLIPQQNLQTAADGSWSVTGLPAGQYTYFVTDLENRFELPLGSPPPLTLADGAMVVVTDTLRSVVAGTASLSGRVRDAASHLPIAGAVVTVSRELQGYPVEPVVTDATGAYLIEGLPSGQYYVSAEASGYQTINSGIQIESGPEELNIPLTAQTGIQVGEGSIAGTVIDEFGDPIAGAFVNFSAPQVGGSDGFLWTSTDADGYFELGGLVVTEWAVEVNAYFPGGYGPGRAAVPLTTIQPNAEILISLAPAATISGTLDISRIPAGATYALEVLALDPLTGEIRGFGQIDAQNRFDIEGLGAGEYVVFVRAASAYADPQTFSVLPSYWVDSQPAGSITADGASVIRVGAGETRAGIDLEITEGASISGRVFIAVPEGVTGLPVAKTVDIAAYRLDGGEWLKVPLAQAYASSFNDGLYQMVGLAPGSYRLEFSDYFQGSRSLATTYNGGGTVFEEAPVIVVGPGSYLTARDVVMSVRRPDAAPSTLVLDDLGEVADALEGQIDVPQEVTESDDVTVQVGEELAGEWVSVWANSTPTRIGDWVQVSASGTISVTLPAGLVGEHRVAVQDADSALFGWAPVTIAEGTESPEDGGESPSPGTPPGNPPTSNAPGNPPSSTLRGAPDARSSTTPFGAAEPAPVDNSSGSEGGSDDGTTTPERTSNDEPEAIAGTTDSGAIPLWLWFVVGGGLLVALLAGLVVALRRRTA